MVLCLMLMDTTRYFFTSSFFQFFQRTIRHKYNAYYFALVSCELLNLLAVLLCLLFTNSFLGGRYMKYGLQVLVQTSFAQCEAVCKKSRFTFNLFYLLQVILFYKMPYEERREGESRNPMCYTFPRVAACSYYRYSIFSKTIRDRFMGQRMDEKLIDSVEESTLKSNT